MAAQSIAGAQYQRFDARYGYELIDRPRRPNRWPDEELIRRSQGEDRPRGGLWTYNWVQRRDPVFLVSGDLPRVAMMRTFRNPDVNPSFAVLGDLRVKFRYREKEFWLDERDPLQTRFHPWGTVHRVSESPDFPIQVEMISTLIRGGIAVRLRVHSVEKIRTQKEDLGVALYYGGVTVKEPILSSAYIVPGPDDAKKNQIVPQPGGGEIRAELNLASPMVHPKHLATVTVKVLCDPAGSVAISPPDAGEDMGNRLVFQHHIINSTKPHEFRLLAFQQEPAENPAQRGAALAMDRFDDGCAEARRYYDTLLSGIDIQTPDPYLNAAFYAAAVNLDALYQQPAWLEGLHKWNTYFANNYQLSGALGLGQLDRVREALLFAGDRAEGPCPPLLPDGSVFKESNLTFEDGVPYYILQLYRYWRASGDMATLNRLWPRVVESLNKVLKARDPDGNLLLNWHLGTNMFLYQGDHLFLPGDAASPTLMLADNLEKMAEMAVARGDPAQAESWRRRADFMRNETVRRLWDPARGKFTGCIDPQGQQMVCNYYTDFIYPQLYSTLPAHYAWQSLRALDRTLWVGDHLMRVGNFKPALFGNDNVMPVQMAEAAEAYFQAGRAGEGARLLHGVALGATVLTDSPGAFPERMSDSGFGQPDYVFGNPVGAYLQAVIGGLFGLERTASQWPLRWQPAVPPEWASARLRVEGIGMIIQGRQGDRTFRIKIEGGPQALEMRIPLYDHQLDRLTNGRGQKIPFTLESHPGGGFVHLHRAPAKEHVVRMTSHARKEAPGEQPHGATPITDPPKPAGFIEIPGHREPLDLTTHFNSESINGRNFWAWGPLTFDLTGRTDPKGMLTVAGSPFKVRPTGKNLSLLELGNFSGNGDVFFLSEKPNRIRLPIGRAVKGIELLLAAEFQMRLTGMEVGALMLQYHDGSCRREPLIYGGKIDCTLKPFANEVKRCELTWLRHLAVANFTADERRPLDWAELRVTSADGALAILAANSIETDLNSRKGSQEP